MWDFSGIVAKLVLVIATSGLVFTIWVFGDALNRLKLLRAHGQNGNRRRYMQRVVRHETFRLIKHSLLVVAAMITIMDLEHYLVIRNWIVIAVSILMAENSLLDLIDRRRGYRGYLREKEKKC
jgi:hypothetical protein